MSTIVSSWVLRNSKSKLSERLVLLAIADHASDDGGEAWPSIATICRYANVSENTCHSALRRLVELGELRIEVGASYRRTNLYQIVMHDPPRTGTPPEPVPPQKARRTPPKKQRPTPPKSVPELSLEPSLDPSSKGVTSEAADAAPDPTPAEPPAATDRGDVERICQHLAQAMISNGCRPPAITQKWRDAARRLIDIDGKTEQQIHAAIDWCQADTFWRANVLSLPTLREKYDQMRLQAGRDTSPTKSRQQQQTDDIFAGSAQRMGAADPTPRTGGVFDDPRREFADHQVGPGGVPAAELRSVHPGRVASVDGGPRLW